MANDPKPQAPERENRVNPRAGANQSTQPAVSKGGRAPDFNKSVREIERQAEDGNRQLGRLYRPGPRSV